MGFVTLTVIYERARIEFSLTNRDREDPSPGKPPSFAKRDAWRRFAEKRVYLYGTIEGKTCRNITGYKLEEAWLYKAHSRRGFFAGNGTS